MRPFYKRIAERRLLEGIAANAQAANKVVETIKSNPANTYDALIGLVGQMAFQAAAKGEQFDLDTLKDLGYLVQGAKALELKERSEDRKDQELTLAKQKLELDFQIYKDKVAEQKQKLESQLYQQ